MQTDKQDLEKRRGQAAGKLLELKARRGSAVLDGKQFPHEAEIGELEKQIMALDEAEGEQVRRSREGARWKYQTQCESLRGDLMRLEVQRLRQVSDANVATNTLARSLSDAMATTRQMAEVVHALSGSAPVQMGQPDTVARLSGRLSAVMTRNISGCPQRFGNIQWLGGSIYQPDEDWAKSEKALMDPHLEAATKVSPSELSTIKKEKGNSDDKQTSS